MRLLWLIPITVAVAGVAVFLRTRRRREADVSLTTEPVSADWLAQARGREEHRW